MMGYGQQLYIGNFNRQNQDQIRIVGQWFIQHTIPARINHVIGGLQPPV